MKRIICGGDSLFFDEEELLLYIIKFLPYI